MKHKYWMIKLYGHHLIRAESAEEALEIAKRHDIGREVLNKIIERHGGKRSPSREHRIHTEFTEAPKEFRDKVIQRRHQQGLGGKIWCEDEKGNLMFETEEGDQYAKT